MEMESRSWKPGMLRMVDREKSLHLRIWRMSHQQCLAVLSPAFRAPGAMVWMAGFGAVR